MYKYATVPALFALLIATPQIQSAEEKAKEAVSSQAAYQARNFEHLLGNVPGLSDNLLKMHFKLYEGYVKNSNLVLQKISELNASGQNKTPEYAGLKRMLGWEMDGMLLHEYYFDNLGAKPLGKDDPLQKKIAADFGSFDQWKADFIATGQIRGIGWVVSYIEPKSGRLVNEWINEHDVGHLAGATPLLIMDVFEHAFITEFGLDRPKYIETFFNNINWEKVSERFKAVTTSKANT